MNENTFIIRKQKLKSFLEEHLSISNNGSIADVLEILKLYNYDNRLKQKGALTHYVIDSGEMDYSIGEKIIEFDNIIK